ncbi:glucose-6-phosphate dehydrogenase [Buchnera aphidicola (Muscaphis stroyani)]|uniref:Glucose-6-phosphate 1-dehydrogenase n=1 Tax=Buchnera aphidicola (Muscaphis stroyani) TaxID=1241869 RepID=A0A4D6YCV8_9GAMM|nr:glucose-6-phosphate dehydrogenase [Buchnera aphidicola]QCI24391.1 glucose-6-phosphate dehydrogenase [Buchnera aphidicola (Muscaphis stroyani)]
MIKNIDTGCDLVIFGAKGDLSKRKLLPALYKLEKSHNIHKNTRIIGAGRANWNAQEYKKEVKNSIKQFLNEEIDDVYWKKLSNRLYFCNIDVYKTSDFLKLKEILKIRRNVTIYYCAVPPSTFDSIFTQLGKLNLNSNLTRIIIEKPLGISLETSQEINNKISKYFLESQIFRIDHYLGKETVLNLLPLRFANSLFYHNWNNKIIDHVQITVSEEVGIENRWNYFDQMGQMKDMVQNHLLQMLTIVAMSMPKNFESKYIQEEKIKILRSLRKIDKDNINQKTARGQYSSGIIKGKNVPSYLKENGSNQNSDTETFVSLKVEIENDQWLGVPFYLRTGKRLAHKYSEIVIYFKKTSNNLFQYSCKEFPQNKLIIRLEPNASIYMNILNKIPGIEEQYKLKSYLMKFNYFKEISSYNLIDAYERLLLESMKGIQSLFVCREEVEEAWKWIDPIVNAWKKEKKSTLQLYKAGSWGPINSNLMINKDNRKWNRFDKI